jgi:hypothetical protein
MTAVDDASAACRESVGHGLDVRVSASFGDEVLPEGLVAIVGRRRVA